MALGRGGSLCYHSFMRLLLALTLSLTCAPAWAKPFPGGAELAAMAKPPKKAERPKPVKKAPAPEPAAPYGGSGYDYFHLMASPDMAAQPVRDAVASPRPTTKSIRK